MAKLDAQISLLLANKAHNDQLPPAERRTLEDPVNIRLTFQGELTALQQLGFKPGAVYGSSLAAGRVSLEVLELLAKHPNVLAIERMRSRHLTLKNTVPRIKVDQLRTRNGAVFSGLTGEGVVIGIIDSGIDFRHPSFINADGKTTRIKKIWDQTLKPAVGEKAPGAVTDPVLTAKYPVALGYGVEYTEAQINDNLLDSPQGIIIQHKDIEGHGTCVAGIAAGNGSRSGNCESAFTYVGVAPRADLIIVKLWEDTPTNSAPATSTDVLLDAIYYILREVAAMKTNNKPAPPVVINLSMGQFTEYMAGDSMVSAEIDRLLTAIPKFAFVTGAGNEGNAKFHVRDTVPAKGGGALQLKFVLQPDDKKDIRTVAVVYSGFNLRVRAISPLGTPQATTSWAEPGGPDIKDVNANGPGGEVNILNEPGFIYVAIKRPASGYSLSNSYWMIDIEDIAGTATPVDVLCIYGGFKDAKSARFHDDSHPTPLGTLAEEASTRHAITVGNYDMHTESLHISSSRGKTLDQRMKPEIVAPGHITYSAASNDAKKGGDYRNWCCDCYESAYYGFNGTSAAAPHVTGVVALIMQQNPTWNYAQIKEKLLATAEPKPADLSPEDDAGWGVGMVNAETATSNGGGGGGGGGMMAPSPEDSPLNQRLRSSGRSHELTQLFRKYFFEIRALINSNKKVATVWHRNKGPAWIKAAFRAIDSPALPLPFEVEGRSLTESIQHMLAILKRYGSPMLVQDMEKYAPEFQALREGMNLFELIDAVDPLPQP
jgi:subtilisin family serine protease